MSRDAMARRLAALETAARRKKPTVWNAWQHVLSQPQKALLWLLAARGATHGGDPGDVASWHDDWRGWAKLCQTDEERDTLHQIERVAAGHPEIARHSPLWAFVIELRL